MVPSHSITSFLLGKADNHYSLNQLMKRLRKNKSSTSRDILSQCCRRSLFGKYQKHEDKDRVLGPVAVNALILKDSSLFTKAIQQMTVTFESGYYFDLGRLICLDELVVEEHELGFLIMIFYFIGLISI